VVRATCFIASSSLPPGLARPSSAGRSSRGRHRREKVGEVSRGCIKLQRRMAMHHSEKFPKKFRGFHPQFSK
jgi:hypothetical protein